MSSMILNQAKYPYLCSLNSGAQLVVADGFGTLANYLAMNGVPLNDDNNAKRLIEAIAIAIIAEHPGAVQK